MYYVYCLQHRKTSELYYGYSADLRRRSEEHGKFWKLVYYEAYLSKTDAENRERKLKQYGQARTHLKNRMVNSLSDK